MQSCGRRVPEAVRAPHLQIVALTSVPDGELWRSFPEVVRSDIVGLLGVLLERWAVSAGLAAEGTGGEHGASG